MKTFLALVATLYYVVVGGLFGVWLAVWLNCGVFGWLTFVVYVFPVVVIWYRVVREREANELDMLMHGAGISFERADKAIEEWIQIHTEKGSERLRAQEK